MSKFRDLNVESLRLEFESEIKSVTFAYDDSMRWGGHYVEIAKNAHSAGWNAHRELVSASHCYANAAVLAMQLYVLRRAMSLLGGNGQTKRGRHG